MISRGIQCFLEGNHLLHQHSQKLECPLPGWRLEGWWNMISRSHRRHRSGAGTFFFGSLVAFFFRVKNFLFFFLFFGSPR